MYKVFVFIFLNLKWPQPWLISFLLVRFECSLTIFVLECRINVITDAIPCVHTAWIIKFNMMNIFIEPIELQWKKVVILMIDDQIRVL